VCKDWSGHGPNWAQGPEWASLGPKWALGLSKGPKWVGTEVGIPLLFHPYASHANLTYKIITKILMNIMVCDYLVYLSAITIVVTDILLQCLAKLELSSSSSIYLPEMKTFIIITKYI